MSKEYDEPTRKAESAGIAGVCFGICAIIILIKLVEQIFSHLTVVDIGLLLL